MRSLRGHTSDLSAGESVAGRSPRRLGKKLASYRPSFRVASGAARVPTAMRSRFLGSRLRGNDGVSAGMTAGGGFSRVRWVLRQAQHIARGTLRMAPSHVLRPFDPSTSSGHRRLRNRLGRRRCALRGGGLGRWRRPARRRSAPQPPRESGVRTQGRAVGRSYDDRERDAVLLCTPSRASI